MRMKKKGALELSINAIVILILAITMLGLGLGFMRKTFGGVTAQFGEVSDQMKKEMIDRIKESATKVMLNVYELEMKPSDEKNIYLAIKNDLNIDDTFNVCTKNNGGNCGAVNLDCSYVELPAGSSSPVCDDITVTTFKEKTIVRSNIEVLPVKIKVSSGAKATTYLIPVVVSASTTGEQQRADLYITVK